MTFFAAHFEATVLETRGAGLRNRAANFRRSGKRNRAHIGVAHQRASHVVAAARHQIHNAAGHAGFLQDLHQVVGGERRIGGGFQDHRVPADQRGHDLPRRNGHGEIPRRDQSANTSGLRTVMQNLFGKFGGGGLSKEAAPFARHGRTSCRWPLAHRHAFRPTPCPFARHGFGELLLVLLQQSGRAIEDLPALGWGVRFHDLLAFRAAAIAASTSSGPDFWK